MTSPAFYHEVNVSWGDCDPAKIVHTARIPWFALDAINAFWEHVLGGDGWFQLELDRNVGTPFVHMSIDFRSPVTPRHRLICKTRPMRLGTSSIEFEVIGKQDDKTCFEGRFVCVFTVADEFKKRSVPQEFRSVLAKYLPKELP